MNENGNKAAHGPQRIIITKNGQDTVALVPISDLEILAELERIIDVHDARLALEEAKAEGTVSLEKLKEDLGY
jgi:prevent-host-death family protein